MNESEEDNDFKEETSELEPAAGEAEASGEEFFSRVRLPRGKELVGVIVQRLGGNRMEVLATDKKVRNCRVPGRYKRKLWLRPKDIVMIEPWVDDDSKGDVIYKYSSGGINQLRKKGILDSLREEF